jgi:hypothetical protein
MNVIDAQSERLLEKFIQDNQGTQDPNLAKLVRKAKQKLKIARDEQR